MRDRGNFEVIASMLAGPSHSSRIQAALGVPGEFGPLHQLQHWFHCGDSMEAMPAMLPGAGTSHGGAHDGMALRSSMFLRKGFAAGLPRSPGHKVATIAAAGRWGLGIC